MLSPSVSIVIATCDRCGLLRETLMNCLNLRPGPEEIIVIDDASQDNTRDMMQAYDEHPIRYIRLPVNSGQAIARSIGMATARGGVIACIDDDAQFMDEDALYRIVQRFRERPDCGILTFRVFTSREEILPSEDRVFSVSEHLEGASAYRKSLMDRIGYYLPVLREGAEGTDISLRALDARVAILLDRRIRVFHDYNPDERAREITEIKRRRTMKNDLLEVWVRFPWPWILPATVYKAISHFHFGLRHGLVAPTIMGFGDFLLRLPKALVCRKPVSNEALKRYLTLRRNPIEV